MALGRPARRTAHRAVSAAASATAKILLDADAVLAQMEAQQKALETLLEQLLTASNPSDTVVMRALAADASSVRATGLKAAISLVRGPGKDKAAELMSVLDDVLDTPGASAHFTYGVLSLYGELGGSLHSGSLEKLLARLDGQLSIESESIAKGAARGLAAALGGALAAGMIEKDEVQARLEAGLKGVAEASGPVEARVAAFQVGAACSAVGSHVLPSWGVVAKLFAVLGDKASAVHAREAALLSLEQLCLRLRKGFEPYLLPVLEDSIISLYSDKERRVSDAAAKVVTTLVTGLNPLSVKLVLPALYRGMEATAWRTKEACMQALGQLATHAPKLVGPCLQEAMPKLVECLNESNAKVQAAAVAAIPIIIACVDNSETQTLKTELVNAIVDPSTTSHALEEILTTTFVNALDGTSLAFIMPVIIRGLREPSPEGKKRAVTCASNIFALIKSPSDIAPFLPSLLAEIEKCREHSSPDVREGAETAKARLEAGAKPDEQPSGPTPSEQVVASLRAAPDGVGAALPAELLGYLGDTGAASLELELGGEVKAGRFVAAPKQLAAVLAEGLDGYGVPAAAVAAAAAAAVEAFKRRLSRRAASMLADDISKDYALDVQDCILAFAGRVLLHGCDLRFERGHRYGLIGQNGVGKTTLLNRLAAKDIKGYDMRLKTHYIRHEVNAAEFIDVRKYMAAEGPAEATADDILKTLDAVGFPENLQTAQVSTLSGGWKMKLSIALSILHKPELLLLDEPTNHLDKNAIEWLKKHLLSLEGVTILCVSHDYDFLDEVASDIAHYDNGGKPGKPCRLVYYPTSFKEFQKLNPEVAKGLPTAKKAMAAAKEMADDASDRASSSGDGLSDVMGELGLEGDASAPAQSATISRVEAMIEAGQILPIRFPDPGKPEGVRTFRKPIMTLKEVAFQYDGAEKRILEKANATVTLGSRAVLLGANGVGKSTFLKILVGDLEPADGVGEVWKHHHLRVSYIAQHSLHHLENHLNSTPLQYIQERFREGQDKEIAQLKTLVLTDEEKEMMKGVGNVGEVVGRQTRGKQVWYEVIKCGRKKQDTHWFPLSEIELTMHKYVLKLIKNFDDRANALESGLAIRPLTSAEILAHLEDFGVDSTLAHGKIKQMSGGQRCRLVLAAAFWSKPHMIALDEPTNYLDNDTLAALTLALKTFKGAVVTVSHNEAFVAEIVNEKWIVENGGITAVQVRDIKAR